MMRCVKTEKGGEGGGLQLLIRLSLYNEAIWWHKSVVSEVFLQALLFISYICKVPENILVTFNHKHLPPVYPPNCYSMGGLFGFAFFFQLL